MTRLDFLRGSVATAAFSGMPASVMGAANLLGKPDLVIGLLSDIHIQLPPTVKSTGTLDRFRHALEYFRDREVDGVLVSGDLANAGLETELAAVARAWFEVFPGGKLPNGQHVANLMHYGDHDAETRFYTPAVKDPFVRAGLPVPRSLSEGENRKVIWEKLFHEPWAPVRHVKVKGYDFVLSNFMREGSASAPSDLESRLNALKLDPDKPFFYSQHRWIRGTYLTDEEMWGADNGIAYGVLSKFPNAVAFQGHTHYMLTDDRTVWVGPFVSVNNGSLLNQWPARKRENGPDISWLKDDPMRDSQMKCLDGWRVHAGLVMSVYRDKIVLERRDFESDRPLGPDLVFSVDPKKRHCDAQRREASVAPEFSADAKVSVLARSGRDRAGRSTEQVVVSFPPARSGGGRPRAFDYVVRAERADGGLVKEKRVFASTAHMPESVEAKTVECVFSRAEVARATVFSARPCNCWGKSGGAIRGNANGGVRK